MFSRSHDGVREGVELRQQQPLSLFLTSLKSAPPDSHEELRGNCGETPLLLQLQHVGSTASSHTLLNPRQRLTYFTLPAWNDVSPKGTCECFLNVGPSCRVCLHRLLVGGARRDVIKEDKEGKIRQTCLRFSVLVM